jgi:hypothetical protein
MLAGGAMLAGCSGGGGSSGGADFVAVQTEPQDNGLLFLNDAIKVDFTNPVDFGTVDLSTFAFAVFDQNGNVVAEPVAGEFQLGATPGDAAIGRRLLFVPRLPTNDLFSNGGFRPGRTYRVNLVGGDRIAGTTMRDRNARPLAQPRTFQFSTAAGLTSAQLFRDTAVGGPRRVSFTITPTPDTAGVVLNKIGSPPLELRLTFDQPLNPSSGNVPFALNVDPLVRSSSNRGRIFLEYDDPVTAATWIPADIDLESNSATGATVVIRPLGVLPNNALVRVVVQNTLEDISGESNVNNQAYQAVFGTFRTRRAYDQQFDGLVDQFLAGANVDGNAAFPEPPAEVGADYVRAGFAFEGSTTGADFNPEVPVTVLNTNFTQVIPANGGSPFNVSGGVFNFRNVTIDTGRSVEGAGSNPMVWLVNGTMTIRGTLSVQGGKAQPVASLFNADVPKPGGVGKCGGGDGGDGSPSSFQRDINGETGNGPLQVPNGGGLGGDLYFAPASCGGRGAGGGGGSMATQGDPNFKVKTIPPNPPGVPSAQFVQQLGVGGSGGCGASGLASRDLPGATPGPLVFTDSRLDNNFWGAGINFGFGASTTPPVTPATPLRILGELAVPVGGGGGGGGGDLSYNNSGNTNEANFANDSSGGGGGGGGGVLIVKALGPIIIDGGRITADGGNGTGGEPASSSARGGGGGGGAGGMVILMSATRIDIQTRGMGTRFRYGSPQTPANPDNNDYDFAISADGGVCITQHGSQAQQPPVVAGKYLASGTAITSAFATSYDSVALGGFGGMGIVQLMTPPGTNADNTNTILDDNINIYRGVSPLSGSPATGQQKRDLIAWRGFPDAANTGRDDFGNPTGILDNEGDIRPVADTIRSQDAAAVALDRHGCHGPARTAGRRQPAARHRGSDEHPARPALRVRRRR